MALAFNWRGDDDSARVEDSEILLGEPDHAESESLPLHTDKCARRYRVTILRLNRLDRTLASQRMLLWVLLIAVVAMSDKAAAILKFIAGVPQ
ncbi:MAG TPA: hypothetical protein VG867_02975 [Rhizomicrobium sp.]|nr:hypothetical protein [Rhizomicrobium sp.]